MSKSEELHFHNELFKKKQYSLAPRNGAYLVVDNAFDFYRTLIEDSQPKNLLELASSTGLWSSYFQELGIEVCAIDLSFEASNLCLKRNEKVQVLVGDVQNLPISLGHFDCAIGAGIVHHIDLDSLLDQINSCNIQQAVFIEPLVHNPLIQLYRFMTPNSRTKGEQPLSISQIDKIQKIFPQSTFRYFGLLTLLLTPFAKYSNMGGIVELFQQLDEFIFIKVPILRKYAWIVVMNVQKSPSKHSK